MFVTKKDLAIFFPTELLTEVEYVVDVELNITDVVTLDYLRSILSNASFSMALGDTVNVTQINITTGQNSFPSDIIHDHDNGHLCSICTYSILFLLCLKK